MFLRNQKSSFFISLFTVRVNLVIVNLKSFYKMLTYLINTVDLLSVKIEVRNS